VPPGPAPPDPDFPPGGEGRLLPSDPGWLEDEAYLAALSEDDDPGDPELDQDPDNAPPAGLDDAGLAALLAGARELTVDRAWATAWLGRRGPGMPGSARRFPGEYAGPAAGFAAGRELDTAPGCAVLALFAEDAAGPGDRYPGASEDELIGAICAWDRVEASAAARKHAAAAELIRRLPAPPRRHRRIRRSRPPPGRPHGQAGRDGDGRDGDRRDGDRRAREEWAGALGAGRAGQLVTGWRAAGRGGTARVRRQGQPDHPGHHSDPARGPARRTGRHRAHRP
jgi:hypothetical protein